jgi:hypothetical protein
LRKAPETDGVARLLAIRQPGLIKNFTGSIKKMQLSLSGGCFFVFSRNKKIRSAELY